MTNSRWAWSVAIVLTACASAASPGTTSAPVPAPVATVDIEEQTLRDCAGLFAGVVVRMFDSQDVNEAIDMWGMDSGVFQLSTQTMNQAAAERIHRGYAAAMNYVSEEAWRVCDDPMTRNLILGLRPGDLGYLDPNGPAPAPTDSPAGTVDQLDLAGEWWWTRPYQPAPAHLVTVNDRWSNGQVPEPYSWCALPGSRSAPADWGAVGEVLLEQHPDGGWVLRWPGEYGQYIRVMTEDDVSNTRYLFDVVGGPGERIEGATMWVVDEGSSLLHIDDATCWIEWGISPTAPEGAQRAFRAGMMFMESTGPGLD